MTCGSFSSVWAAFSLTLDPTLTFLRACVLQEGVSMLTAPRTQRLDLPSILPTGSPAFAKSLWPPHKMCAEENSPAIPADLLWNVLGAVLWAH